MNRGGPAWRTLGIEPTDDTRAIRRAYAAKLKAIDVDRDPQAFIALREAFEQAQSEAQWLRYEQEEDEEAEAETAQAEASRPDQALSEPEEDPDEWDDEPGIEINFDAWERDPLAAEIAFAPPAPNPWAPPTPEDYDDHARALAGLLLGEHAEQWPSPEETEAMLAHWQRITRDPRMQEMSFYADAENWFADLIARAVPFSDPLVASVADHFGWMSAAGEISQSPAIAYVVRRRQSLDFFEAVRAPSHPLHAAWRELTRPAHEKSRRGWVRGKRVRELLATVRTHYPELEANFDSYRVEMWEPTSRSGGWNWTGMIVVWILISLLHFANSQCKEQNRFAPIPGVEAPVIPETLGNERVDIDRVLEALYERNLDIATIEDKNPELYVALMTYWKDSFLRKDSWVNFTNGMIPLLNARVQAGIPGAPLPLLRDYHRLALDRALALRAVSPDVCANYFAGKDYDGSKLPKNLAERNRAIMARILLATRAGPDGKSTPSPEPSAGQTKTFNVPGFIMEKASTRAGMTREQLGQAMRYQGSNAQQCNGRIAFMQTVLAEPDDKVGKLLRTL
ncbi:hypothetical protein [Sphingomonas sp. NIBR02145]|uniref:hypothetical protein n=1 Tax=Sphingomonas sp. NIBR02145 TaxID=3014784 RepID=UPI0022B49092|nr:hypothetical protein [Sphingomonas sp. NIBR02145]WHU04689.1 hypothetical protein O3305_08900 [Sphingomonas sp. NIBR02145]